MSNASLPNPKKLAAAKSWPVQFSSFPVLATAAIPQLEIGNVFPVTMSRTVSSLPFAAGVKSQHFLEHRDQITDMSLLSCVLLSNLYPALTAGLVSPPNSGEIGSYLEVHRTVLDLKNDIVLELAVNRHEIVIS